MEAAATHSEIDFSELGDDVLYTRAIEKSNAGELDETVLYFRELQVCMGGSNSFAAQNPCASCLVESVLVGCPSV